MPNETDAVESPLAGENFDSPGLIDQLMIEESEPQSLSDIVPPSDQFVDLSPIEGSDDSLNQTLGSDDAVPVSAIDELTTNAATEHGWRESLLEHFGSISLPPVDTTAFKTLPFEDLYSNGILLVSIVAFVFASLFVTGAAMKLACRITGGTPITVRRGIVATVLVSLTYAVAAVVGQRFSADSSTLSTFALQVVAGTFLLAWVLWQNPVRALATGVVASILQTVFLFGFFAATFILIGKFAPPQKLQQLAKHTQSFTDSLAKEVLPGDEKKTRKLLSVESLIASPAGRATAASKPKVPMHHERGKRNNPFAE